MAKSLDIIDPKKELQDEDEKPKHEFNEMGSDENGGGGLFYLIIGIIAVVVAVLSALFVIYKDKNKQAASSTPTPTVSASQVSVTASPSATPSVTASTQPSTQSSTQFSTSSIRIANGNGINGEAARIKKLLEAKGYKINSTGNASRTYTKTIIYYKTGNENLAKALQNDLTAEYSSDINQSDQVVGSYDAVIALGSK